MGDKCALPLAGPDSKGVRGAQCRFCLPDLALAGALIFVRIPGGLQGGGREKGRESNTSCKHSRKGLKNFRNLRTN